MKVVFRADAYRAIGTGHIMRCLALAQGCFEKGMDVVFLTNCKYQDVLERLESEGFEVRRLEVAPNEQEMLSALKEDQPEWVVLDGFHFNEHTHSLIKHAGYQLLVIDDMAKLSHYEGDIIVNQNLHADNLRYSCGPETKCLLGTKYVILRREFREKKGLKRHMPETASHILLTMGGGDLGNNTEKLMKALEKSSLKRLHVSVIVGTANPNYKRIKHVVDTSRHDVSVVHNAQNMAEHMVIADLAITAGGTTVWELACLGTPAMVGITASIEEYLLGGLIKHDLFRSLGKFDELGNERFIEQFDELAQNRGAREEMSIRGQQVVDGLGVERIINTMLDSRN